MWRPDTRRAHIMIQSEVAVRSGTTAEWADTDASDGAAAPILGAGELGVNTDTGDVRVGDGTTAFASLRRSNSGNRGKATLVAGTKTVTDASVTATCIILLTVQALGTVTAAKAVSVTARSAGVSFTMTSSDNTDTSIVGYQIIEP